MPWEVGDHAFYVGPMRWYTRTAGDHANIRIDWSDKLYRVTKVTAAGKVDAAIVWPGHPWDGAEMVHAKSDSFRKPRPEDFARFGVSVSGRSEQSSTLHSASAAEGGTVAPPAPREHKILDSRGQPSAPSDPVEADLRRLLMGARLVCERAIPEDLLAAAEEAFTQALRGDRVEPFAATSPATLVAYVAVRGAERYEGHALWPQLGVQHRSTEVGRAFLGALERLGLPTFEEMVQAQNARRYVSPILVHGGLPSQVAHALVTRVEQLLERGLVDGAEAVTRLQADPYLVSDIGRPAARLLRYAPEYSAQLIDAVIDHVTGEDTSGEGLPRHIRNALAEVAHRGGARLARLRPPWIEFDPWTGLGPAVVAANGSRPWDIRGSSFSFQLENGQRAEIRKAERTEALHGGRLIQLLDPAPGYWFGIASHRPVPPTSALDEQAVLLLHQNGLLKGNPVDPRIMENGIPLSGGWSQYRSMIVDLEGVAEVWIDDAEQGHGLERRTVGAGARPALVGRVVPHALGPDDCAVYSAPPRLRAPGPDADIPAWFRPVQGSTLFARLRRVDGLIELSELLRPSTAGWLEVGLPNAAPFRNAIAVAGGLATNIGSAILAPDDTFDLELRADPGVMNNDIESIGVPGGLVEMPVHLIDLPDGAVRIVLPRVQWGLLSPRPGRLELAPGLIGTSIASLLEDGLRLVVRTPGSQQVQLALHKDGEQAQVAPAVQTHVVSPGWAQAAIPLTPFTDTLRHSDASLVELMLVFDGRRIPAVRAVSSVQAPAKPDVRSWAPVKQLPTGRPVDWPQLLSWWKRGLGDYLSDANLRASAKAIRQRLDGLDVGDQVVGFCVELGRAYREWLRDGRRSFADDPRWKAFERAADEIWQLAGVRHRLFNNRRPTESVKDRAHHWRTGLRREDATRRNAIELWSLGRAIPFSNLGAWAHLDLVRAAYRDTPHASAIDNFVPTVLYHLLRLVSGDLAAGPAVADAAAAAPEPVVELVALFLQLTATATPIVAPPRATVPDDGEEDAEDEPDDEPVDTLPGLKRRALTIDNCSVSVDGRIVHVAAASPVSGYALRLTRAGQRAAGAFISPFDTNGETGIAVVPPPELEGPHLLTVVDPRHVSCAPTTSGRPCTFPPQHQARPSFTRSSSGLADLSAALVTARLEPLLHAIASGQLGAAEAGALFQDEHDAVDAICHYASTSRDQALLDRLALAILPSAVLFERLSEGRDPSSVRRASPLLFAVLFARRADDFRSIGLPGGAATDAVVGWARHFHRDAAPVGIFTWRYELPASLSAPRDVLTRLSPPITSTYVDLASAAVCARSVETVEQEATRMLLSAHVAAPALVSHATIVGLAAACLARK